MRRAILVPARRAPLKVSAASAPTECWGQESKTTPLSLPQFSQAGCVRESASESLRRVFLAYWEVTLSLLLSSSHHPSTFHAFLINKRKKNTTVIVKRHLTACLAMVIAVGTSVGCHHVAVTGLSLNVLTFLTQSLILSWLLTCWW